MGGYDETDHIVAFKQMSEDYTKIWEEYGFVPLSSIEPVFHIAPSISTPKELAPQLPGHAHYLYVNRF